MPDNHYSMQQVEGLIRLVKKGDSASLAELRQQLGKTVEEMAERVGVYADEFMAWETGKKQPTDGRQAFWRLRLSDYVDDAIIGLLGTSDSELVTKFWEIMWRLNE